MGNAEKMTEMVKENPELQKKVGEEIRRLAESGEATDVKSAFGAAARNVLGIGFTDSELEEIFTEVRELTPDELDQTAGGFNIAKVVGCTLAWAGSGAAVLGGGLGLVTGVPGLIFGAVVGGVGVGAIGAVKHTVDELKEDGIL